MSTLNTKKTGLRTLAGSWSQRGIGLAVVLFAAATLGAEPSAAAGDASQGQQWTYDIHTTGGHAQGRVYFKRAAGSCYQAGTDGYLDDTSADNTSVEVYLHGVNCRTGQIENIHVARVGGASKKPRYYNSGYRNGLKDVTVKLCRWKDGQEAFDCRLPSGSRS